MKLRNGVLAALVLVVGMSGTASAGLIVTGSVGGAPTGVTLDNLDWAMASGGGSSTMSGIVVNLVHDGGVALGTYEGLFAAPYLSGSNGVGFGAGGSTQAAGVDETPFLTSGASAGAGVEIVLPGSMRYFGLLWGSVDSYNLLSFYDGDVLVGQVSGADVLASPDGDQGVNGTLYVNIASDLAFNRVVATSSTYAFELDNVAYNATTPVPEPASALLIGSGLLGVGVAARRRRRK